MKKLMIAILAIGLAMVFTQCEVIEENNTVILSGKIENPNSEFIVFSMVDFPDNRILDTVYLDDDNYFKLKTDLSACGPATLYDGKEIAHLYLCPADSLYISLNTEEFDESIHIEGNGAKVNTLLSEYFLKFMDYENEEVVSFYAIRDTSLDIYIDMVNSKGDNAEAFIDKLKTQQEYPPSFISFMETKIFFNNIGNYQYVFYRKNKDTTEAYLKTIDDITDMIINAADYPNPDYLCQEFRAWLNYNLPMALNSKIRKEHDGEEIQKGMIDSLLYDRLEQLLQPTELQMYLVNKVSRLAYSFNIDGLDALRPMIDRHVTDVEIKADIDKQYDEVRIKVNQSLPDDATLYNLDDDELLELTFDDVLEKYKGNVIYLDFWASWCGPCKAEMPNSAKLSKKLAAEDVVFLYVSTDKDAEAWKRMIRIMQLHGTHYRLGKNTRKPVFETFGIKYIPHYVIFDKEGNMVKNNMTRPSDPETEKMILELL